MSKFLAILAFGALGFYVLQDQGMVQVSSSKGAGQGAISGYLGSSKSAIGGIAGSAGAD